jgi:hypothetical protein
VTCVILPVRVGNLLESQWQASQRPKGRARKSRTDDAKIRLYERRPSERVVDFRQLIARTTGKSNEKECPRRLDKFSVKRLQRDARLAHQGRPDH